MTALPQTSDAAERPPNWLESEIARVRLLLQRHVLTLRGERSEAVAAIDRELSRVDAELHRQQHVPERQPTPLDALTGLFGLQPFERDVVVLALAADVDHSIETTLAAANENPARTRPTPALAIALFSDGDASSLASFGAAGPLRQFRILDLDASDPSPLVLRPIRLAERIVEYLLGTNVVDQRLAGMLRPLPPALWSDDRLVGRITAWLQEGLSRFPRLVVNLVGTAGSGRSTLAAAATARFGVTLYRLNAKRLAAAADRDDLLHLLARDAALLQLGFYVDATDLEPADPQTAAVTETIDSLYAFTVVGSRGRWTTSREMLSVEVPRPRPAEQAAMWRSLLPDSSGAAAAADAVVQQFDFGPGTIAQTAFTVIRENPAPDEAALWRACRERAAATLTDLAQRLAPAVTFDDLVLPADAIAQLRDIAAQVAHRATVYEEWGFSAKLTRGRGISALFSGPSGTGKTMAAEVLANALHLDLYRVDLSGVVSKYIGETEKNLRRVFDAAEESGAVLFVDEADALFGKRTEVKDSHDRYANVEISYLLQRMEEYRGLAILATNLKGHIDQAFLRRLRFVVDFPFPSPADRTEIWRRAFTPDARVGPLDFDALARLDIAGGNIRNIAVNAAFLAAAERRPVSMDDVMRAARREYRKIDRIITPAEFGDYFNAEARR